MEIVRLPILDRHRNASPPHTFLLGFRRRSKMFRGIPLWSKVEPCRGLHRARFPGACLQHGKREIHPPSHSVNSVCHDPSGMLTVAHVFPGSIRQTARSRHASCMPQPRDGGVQQVEHPPGSHHQPHPGERRSRCAALGDARDGGHAGHETLPSGMGVRRGFAAGAGFGDRRQADRSRQAWRFFGLSRRKARSQRSLCGCSRGELGERNWFRVGLD